MYGLSRPPALGEIDLSRSVGPASEIDLCGGESSLLEVPSTVVLACDACPASFSGVTRFVEPAGGILSDGLLLGDSDDA